MNRSCLILLLCLGWLVSGCSAISSRALNRLSTPPPPLYFGGVRTDYELITSSKETGSPLFWPVYGVIDMPFSVGADVLLVPYDVYTNCRHADRKPWPHSATAEPATPAPSEHLPVVGPEASYHVPN